MSDEYTPVDAAVDFRGSDIRVGDTVLYPRQMGQTLEMQEGTVVQIKKADLIRRDRPKGWNYRTDSYDDWIETPYEDYKFRVQPTRSSRYGRNEFTKDWRTDEPIKAKPVWIHIGTNVVKIT